MGKHKKSEKSEKLEKLDPEHEGRYDRAQMSWPSAQGTVMQYLQVGDRVYEQKDGELVEIGVGTVVFHADTETRRSEYLFVPAE